jgi:hypothetical protein
LPSVPPPAPEPISTNGPEAIAAFPRSISQNGQNRKFFGLWGLEKTGWALDSIRKVPGPKWKTAILQEKVLGLFTTGFHIDMPEGAINRLRTILRKKTALIVLDDCRRSHRQRRAFDWGEMGLATPRR